MSYHLWVGLLKYISHLSLHVNDFLPFLITLPCTGLVWRFSQELAGLLFAPFLIVMGKFVENLGLGEILSILLQWKQTAILVPPMFMAELWVVQMQPGLVWSTGQLGGDCCISWSPWKVFGIK